MPNEQEIGLIDYLNMVWKRKGLIIGGTIFAAATALVVSLLMPKTYVISRTLKIGTLPGTVQEGRAIRGKPIESPKAAIDRLKDHRVLKAVLEKIHSGKATSRVGGIVSIDTRINPNVRYTVQARDAEDATRIADALANYIIEIHRPLFERAMEILAEYESGLAAKIHGLETENRSLKKILEKKAKSPNADTTAVALLAPIIGQRERDLMDLRKELKETRFSRLGSANTFVVAADAPPPATRQAAHQVECCPGRHAGSDNVYVYRLLCGILGECEEGGPSHIRNQRVAMIASWAREAKNLIIPLFFGLSKWLYSLVSSSINLGFWRVP